MAEGNDYGTDTHVPLAVTDEDQQRRERMRAKARANVEAFALERHPGDLDAAQALFAEMVDILGLVDGASKRAPGMCRNCGKTICFSRASPSTAGGSVLCGGCERRARTAAPPPASPAQPNPGKVWTLNGIESALLAEVAAGRVYRAAGVDWHRDPAGLSSRMGQQIHHLPPGLVQRDAEGRYGLTAAGRAHQEAGRG